MPLEELLAPPRATVTDVEPFANEPILELRRAPVRAQLAEALRAHDARRAAARAGVDRRGQARGRGAGLDRSRASPSASSRTRPRPPRPRSTRRSRPPGAARASWGARPAAGARRGPDRAPRSGCASAGCEAAALEVRECAKPWREADADVCEAIDFLEYYARGAISLESHPAASPARRRELLQVPGERNTIEWRPRGVVAVISPWNFPVAIPLGMAAAGARHRQRRRAQARRAVARLRARARPGAARGRRAARRAGAAARRGRRRRRAGARPARAHDRVHRLAAGRASRSCARRARRRPGRSTSSA